MKRETIPTSPKYKKAEPVHSPGRWPFITLVLSIILGFSSGFFGQLISLNYPLSWPYAKEIINSGENPESDNIILIKESSFSDHADLVEKLMEQSQSFLLSIYESEKYLGTALILTNDGWLVTSAPVNPNSTLAVISKDLKEYSPAEVISDSWSGLTFLKISAQNLSVAEFAAAEKLGQEILVYYHTPQQENLSLNYLVNQSYYPAELRSTDSYQERYLINQPLADDFYSSPLINLNGKVIGLAQSGAQIIPAKIINNLFNQVVTLGKIKYSALGLSYYDLSYSFSQSSDQDQGALVFQLAEMIPGLRLNDIILKVGDDEIDKDHDLSWLLKQYSHQENIKLTILRNNQAQEIEVEL